MKLGELPKPVSNYIRHTEFGESIRQIARDAGCHASTVHRQIRRMETRRDDVLIDSAIGNIVPIIRRKSNIVAKNGKDPSKMNVPLRGTKIADDDREAMRILRRLSEPEACLAFAADMEKAVVIREAADGRTVRTAITDREVAQHMALRDWLVCTTPGRVSRYRITSSGRAALRRYLADNANGGGIDDSQYAFAEQHREWAHKDVTAENGGRTARVRFNAAESPITLLARRKDKSGEPFLDSNLVAAAERLREDFELAHIGPRVGQNWEKFLTGGDRGSMQPANTSNSGSDAARDRVAAAMRELGSGLADIVLRVCCFVEGVETAEKRLGWSARSVKVVLKIALQRLHEHYQKTVKVR